MMQSLTLSREQLQKMIACVDAHAPLESCGLLAGRDSKVESVLEVTNQARSPLRYVMDPIEQLHAFEWIESNQMDLLGIFHSHPTGPETVSPTDIAEAAYAVVHIILARVDTSTRSPALPKKRRDYVACGASVASVRRSVWRARGFWIENGGFREVTLQII